jgi:5-methylcytosine-specific restriction enzyme subunit McrC
MNKVFEDFVFVALGDALGPEAGQWVQGSARHPLWFDEGQRIELKPDLSLWQGQRCLWIGDAKYKRLVTDLYPNADVYQVAAYAIATQLDRATLIYARSEGTPATHRIVHVGKTVSAVALDLAVPPAQLLAQIASIAADIKRDVAERVAFAA